MKNLLLTALALAAAGSAFAHSTPDNRQLSPTSLPRIAPTSVVPPTQLPSEFAGALIHIEFALDDQGQPRDVRIRSVVTPAVKRQLMKAFAQWRFEGAVPPAAGGPQRYLLPLQLNAEV